ncbi:MAG: PASTA domain-containing protein, partial [Actinomycetota bacterium]|nr:PASTA domain-containing protein [Actinomycetota bacterium]
MTHDVESELRQMFERRSGDVGVSGHLPPTLRNRARRRRLATASSALVLVLLAMTGGLFVVKHLVNDKVTAVDFSNPGERLRVPPPSLLRQVPKDVRTLISRNLVLLYKQGSTYVAYSEGIFPLSCPSGASSRQCVRTAQRASIPGRGQGRHSESDLNSDRLSLPHLDPNTEVLWRGTPRSGSIGIKSSAACDRIARFRPNFTCKQGVPVFDPHPVSPIQVPLVVGMQVDKAARRITAAGLKPEVDGSTPRGRAQRSVSICNPQVFCPATWVARNRVIVVQQDPLPGTIMKPGMTVTLLAGLRKNLRSFRSADAWIRALNHQGVVCTPDTVAKMGPRIAHQDEGTCQLEDGSRVVVLIVRDARKTYERHFAGAHGPHYFLYRANWLAIVNDTAPANVV